MAYRFKRSEPVADGIRRVALEQLDGAVTDLQRPRQGDAIHRARKRLKMLRALLRLVRSDLKSAVFDRENAALRDLGRRLSVIRDADVLLEVVHDLRPASGRHAAFERVLRHLRQHRRSIRHEFFDDAEAIAQLRAQAVEARSRLDDWASVGGLPRTLFDGLRASYRRGRQTYEAAYRGRNDGRWHEWRKRTKDYWYHLRLFCRVWPSVMGAAVAQCKELADVLGDDHDLVVIGHRLMDVSPDVDVGRESRRLRTLIGRRRTRLQDKAREIGVRLFEERPRVFIARVEACWHEWRG